MSTPTQFSAEDFFAQQPPPKDLDKRLEAVQRFVERNVNEGRRVVLITVRLAGASELLEAGWGRVDSLRDHVEMRSTEGSCEKEGS